MGISDCSQPDMDEILEKKILLDVLEVSYIKIVGIGLTQRMHILVIGSQIPSNIHMLGQIIGAISTNNIYPYNLYFSDLRAVNQLRRSSAHTGLLVKNDADTIRNLFYANNLLNNLT